MSGPELLEMLARAERNPAWLAQKVGRSRTQIVRWTEEGPPSDHVDYITSVLPPVSGAKS